MKSRRMIARYSSRSLTLGAPPISLHGVMSLQNIQYFRLEQCSFLGPPERLLTPLDTVATSSAPSHSRTSTTYQLCLTAFCPWANWTDEDSTPRSEIIELLFEQTKWTTLLPQGSRLASLTNTLTRQTTRKSTPQMFPPQMPLTQPTATLWSCSTVILSIYTRVLSSLFHILETLEYQPR